MEVSRPDIRRRRKYLLLSGLILLLGGAAVAGWLLWRGGSAPAALPDPRVTYPSAYQNVRPDVAYVAEDRCAECHADIAAKYRTHPMGRSLAPVAGEPDLGHYGEAAKLTFKAAGFEYRVTKQQSVVTHEEIKRGPDDEVAYALTREVHYAVGSGAQGRSYLIERDGYLFVSPISWYSTQRRWGLSPGYEKAEFHFERPVQAECLFCHADQVAPIAGTANRYAPPTFRGHAIGCQRCHGPGELHVRDQEAAWPASRGSIVNPARLEPRLRDAVCEQCHLQGQQRVERMGRSLFEFRPGMPLELFIAAFVLPAEQADHHKAVSHAEQMAVSNCAKKSAGKLGCISCHDPHMVPAPAAKLTHYRDRCLNCHGHDTAGCTLPSSQRGPSDDCVACHMPRRDSSNIAHTSVTDHRILRKPAAEAAPPPPPLRAEQVPLTRFHPPTGTLDERDLGIALVRLAVSRQAPPLAALALPRLDAALAEYPNDAGALEARASALGLLGRREEALQDANRELRLTPGSEYAQLFVASQARQQNQFTVAADAYRRALAINPYNSEYHHGLAFCYFRSNDWGGACDAASSALALNPARLDTRRVLIWSLLKQGRAAEARTEFDRFRAFHPADEQTVASWFGQKLP